MKKRNVIVKYFNSYEEADADSLREAFEMTPEARINAVNTIRRSVYALKGLIADNKVKHVIAYDKR